MTHPTPPQLPSASSASSTATPQAVQHQSFAALQTRGFQAQFATFVLAMMADNIEHVISYWVMWEKFHSAVLGGFAVVSHWLPFLLFSLPAGALAERFDPRRLIQVGMAMFMAASLAWAYFFYTDSLQMWQAMALLILHGCSGVLWHTSSQMLLYDVVPASQLPSAIRLLATGRYLSLLVGPAVGGVILMALGEQSGMLLNAFFYLPNFLWLINAPYGPKFRLEPVATRRAIKGLQDILQTGRDISGNVTILSMLVLAAAASFFVGNSYQAQMPGFVHDLAPGNHGVVYSALLAADALGALIAGLVLEGKAIFPTTPKAALILACLWCLALGGFALTDHYAVALVLLVFAGFLELSFSAMTQTIVQLNAPVHMRGRVIGLYNMSSLGMRAGSGLVVGLSGGLIGIHYSLAGASLLLMAVVAWIYLGMVRTHLSLTKTP